MPYISKIVNKCHIFCLDFSRVFHLCDGIFLKMDMPLFSRFYLL